MPIYGNDSLASMNFGLSVNCPLALLVMRRGDNGLRGERHVQDLAAWNIYVAPFSCGVPFRSWQRDIEGTNGH